MTNQQYTEPWLAIVVDPKRTMSSGRVDIGAFRTYPRDYTPDGPSEYQSIPLDMIQDFGAHCNRYYQLDISVFKSSLDSRLFDLLWNKYWVNSLSSSTLLNNKEFSAKRFSDLAEKLEKAESKLSHSRVGSYFLTDKKKEEESQLTKVSKDTFETTKILLWKNSIDIIHIYLYYLFFYQIFLYTLSYLLYFFFTFFFINTIYFNKFRLHPNHELHLGRLLPCG